LIERTKYIEILETVTKIIYHASKNISDAKLMEIVGRLLSRISADNQFYIKALKNSDNTHSNICMLKCMESLRAIATRYSKRDKVDIAQ
jgi:hypothetical protein